MTKNTFFTVGSKPPSNNNIFVPRCIWLIIDDPLPTIRALRIDGVLEFQQGRNHLMSVDTIIINGGRLIAGNISSTSSLPFSFFSRSSERSIQW